MNTAALMLVRVVVFILLCFFFVPNSQAQEFKNPDFFIAHYSDANGLPQNSIKAIMKDSSNFLWLGTEDGLVRFDGHKFYTFNKTVISVSSNRISGFVPAIGDYNLQNTAFSAYGEKKEIIRILPGGNVGIDTIFFRNNLLNLPSTSITNGNISILQSFPYLFRFSREHDPLLIPAGNNVFYVWSKDKVDQYNKKQKMKTIKGIFEDVFLINTHPYGRLENGNFVDLGQGPKPVNVKLTGDLNRDISESKFSNNRPKFLWNNISQKAYLYFNKRFYSLTETKDHNTLETRLILTDFDFEESNISTVFFDEKLGYLFLGSFTKGLFVLRRKNFQMVKFEGKNRDNVFYAQKPFSNLGILSAQGILFGNPDKKNLDTASVAKEGESRYYLAMNRDSSFWIGFSDVLKKMDKSGKQVLHSYNFNPKVKALYVDDQDILWIGGLKDSLYVLNTLDPKAIPSLAGKGSFGEISCMLKLPGSDLLLGTTKGLFRFNVNTKQIQVIKGIEKANIRSMYLSNGEIWITTYGDGLYHLNKNKLTKLPLDKDQFLATSHCIIEDRKGFFWITTNKGLFQVLKKDLSEFVNGKNQSVYYLYYDKRHGFDTNEFNGGCQSCVLKLADNTISFPSMDGLVWFKPGNIIPELSDKDIFIDRIELDGKRILQTKEVAIPHDFNQLRIFVTTPYFDDRKNLQVEYSYQTDESKPIWLPISSENEIQISHLSSGKHVLIVRKYNGFGKNNFSYKSVIFLVRPAWFETWLFRSGAAILILILFGLILKSRTSYLLKKERERNLYKQYHINSQIVTAINHDIQTPLHFISNSFLQIENHLKKNALSDLFISKMSEETINTINYARSHTGNLLNYIKSQGRSNQGNLTIEEVNVHDIIEHSCQILSGTARYRNVKIINTVPDDFFIKSDSRLFSIIIQNLMDNAVKLSESSIELSSEIDNGKRHLMLRDTAGGIPDDVLKWLNGSYKSYDDWLKNYDFPNHRGLGLVIVKDLAILLNISLVAEKSISGSTIKLSFHEPKK